MNANVTVEAIEQQIAKSKGGNTDANKKNTFNAKDYLDTRLKAGESSKKVRIRILPVSDTDSNFVVELKTHSLKVDKKIADSGFKSFICLNDEQIPNYNKDTKCPLCSKSYELFKRSKELKNEGKTAEADPLYERAKQLMNKTTYILRVIDRAHEDEGVKFLRFNYNSKGEGIYDKLINIYKNKKAAYQENGQSDNYNVFDLQNGRDFILTINRVYDKSGKEMAPSIQVDANDFETPLTKDPELFEKWVSDPKRWYNAYSTRTPDYLSIIADGDIPVRDSNGQWVSEENRIKEKENEANEKKQIIEESNKILEQEIPVKESIETTEDFNTESNVSDDDELPF